MNEQIKRAVRAELARRGMTQKQLAEQVGVDPRQLSSSMTGRTNRVPPLWAAVLEGLDLELVAIPRRRLARLADELELPDPPTDATET